MILVMKLKDILATVPMTCGFHSDACGQLQQGLGVHSNRLSTLRERRKESKIQ